TPGKRVGSKRVSRVRIPPHPWLQPSRISRVSPVSHYSLGMIVVLDHPQELVNIAHVVRAMKNFGLRDLRLVEPVEFDPYRVEGIAHRSGDVLKRVRTYASLQDALADCVHVVAFTARGRTAKRNIQRPRQAATEMLELDGEGKVAMLFGR